MISCTSSCLRNEDHKQATKKGIPEREISFHIHLIKFPQVFSPTRTNQSNKAEHATHTIAKGNTQNQTPCFMLHTSGDSLEG